MGDGSSKACRLGSKTRTTWLSDIRLLALRQNWSQCTCILKQLYRSMLSDTMSLIPPLQLLILYHYIYIETSTITHCNYVSLCCLYFGYAGVSTWDKTCSINEVFGFKTGFHFVNRNQSPRTTTYVNTTTYHFQ